MIKAESILELTNEEIVLHLQYHALDGLYFDVLCTRFEPLFKKGITRWFINGFTYDDYIQEGRIALLEAVHKFDPSINRYFAPLVARTVEFRMINLLRKYNSKKRGQGQKELSLSGYATIEEPSINYESNATSTELYPEDIIAVQAIHADYLDNLSTLERAVHYFQITGHTVDETAEQLMISSVKVRAALDRCRSKLVQLIKEQSKYVRVSYICDTKI